MLPDLLPTGSNATRSTAFAVVATVAALLVCASLQALAGCRGSPEPEAAPAPATEEAAPEVGQPPALSEAGPPPSADLTNPAADPANPAANAADPAANAADPSAAPSGALGGLAAARRLEVQTSLLAVNKALVIFYAQNDRYPASQEELESDPELAGTVASLKSVTRDLTYSAQGGSYTLTVIRADGKPMSVSGSEPGFRGGVVAPGATVEPKGPP